MFQINHGSILEAWTTGTLNKWQQWQVRPSEKIYSMTPSPKVCTLSFDPFFFYTLPTVNNKYKQGVDY